MKQFGSFGASGPKHDGESSRHGWPEASLIRGALQERGRQIVILRVDGGEERQERTSPTRERPV